MLLKLPLMRTPRLNIIPNGCEDLENTDPLLQGAPVDMTPPLVTRIRDAVREVVQMLHRQYFIRVWQMRIGEGTVISFSAKLDKTNPRGIYLGKYTVVTFGAAVLAHDYVNKRDRDVHIGDNCFIGAHSIILPGVTIGDHCIVAAASVVARDVPAGSLVTGNPARVVETNVKTTHYGVRVVERIDAGAAVKRGLKPISTARTE